MHTDELRDVAKLHIRALPHTWSSGRGVGYVAWLYRVVEKLGFVRATRCGGEIVGAVSGIGKLILTLVVDPSWQRKGIGRALLEQLPGKRYVYTQESSVGFYAKMGFIQLWQLGSLIFLCRK